MTPDLSTSFSVQGIADNGPTQRTLRTPIPCKGIGLHSGRKVSMTLRPAAVDTGISFLRTDVASGTGLVPARWNTVVDTRMCTMIGNEHGVTVGTIEHLMAALRGCGVDNVLIELDGPEVPVMDGSSAPFVFLIDCAGVERQPARRSVIRILDTIRVEEGPAWATLAPDVTATLSFEIDFQSAAIGRQDRMLRLTEDSFVGELARARTFGFVQDVDRLRAAGLARGASMDNAVVVDGDAVVNPEGLRFPDEFVRHKMLDAVGDLHLAGHAIVGRYHGHRAGHGVTNRLLHALFAQPDAWRFERLSDAPVPIPGTWTSVGEMRATA